MTAGRILLITLAITISAQARAADASACVDAYMRATNKYTRVVQRANEAGWIRNGGTLGLFICAITTVGAIPCAIGMAGLTVTAHKAKNASLEEAVRLEEFHKLNLVYLQYNQGTVEESREVQELSERLGSDAQTVAGEVARLMESGALCRGGEPAVGFSDFSELEDQQWIF